MPDSPRIHRPLYRVFHLSPAGGIVRADVIEAINDEDAIRRVCAMAGGGASELWDRARFVAKIEPPPNAVSRDPVVSRRAVTVAAEAPGDVAPGDAAPGARRAHH